MKKFMLGAMLAFIFCTLGASAQVTGPSVLRSVGDQLGTERSYRVEMTSDGLHFKDASTGNEVFAVRQLNSQQVTISGVVADLNRLAPDLRRQALKRIALFNYSSPVGTLRVNERTGEVTMQHNVNPRLVPATAIARVATMFGDTLAHQSEVLAQ